MKYIQSTFALLTILAVSIAHGNTEKKLNSRVVKVDECKKVKNYVYRVISEKRYKKLLTLEEIYKFSGIE